MTEAKETREQAYKDISRVLSRFGPKQDISKLQQSKYPDIPKRTWLRWIAKVVESGAPARMAAKLVQKKAAKRAGESSQSSGQSVTDQLPAVIRPEDVAGAGALSAMDIINKCLDDAREVQAYCKSEVGKLRNAKLYMVASRHMLETMKTAAFVSKQLMDAQRIEQFHKVILDEIRKIDPVCAEAILNRMEQVNRDWGISS